MKKYNVITVGRKAVPRNKRLRDSGDYQSSGSASVLNTGGTSGDGHTHDNKATLDAMSIDDANYLWLTQKAEGEDDSRRSKTNAGAADKLTAKRSLWGRLFDGTEDVDGPIKIGEAVISWDAENGCLMVDKGFYSTSFLSSGGKSDTAGTGGGTVIGATVGGKEVTLSGGILEFDAYPTTTSLGLKALAFKDSLSESDIPSLSISKTIGLQTALDGKQDAISDLATIRAYAEEGHASNEGLSVVSAVLQSLQSQIDSVANRTDFDEINASAVFADNLSARRVLTGEYIQIGNAVISWDAEHGCLKVDKGLYSTDFLSSAGFSDTQGAGGGTVIGATIGGAEVELTDGILAFPAYPTTTSLGLKALAFRDSLSESDIPSLSISKTIGLQTTLDGKQAVISDLATIRANASNGNTAYYDLTTVSYALQSLQSQIDSLAESKGDEVVAAVVSTDIVTAQNAYIAVTHGSLDGNAATATNATYAAYDNSGEHIADNFSKVGAALKSLQSQIDSVASRDFAELSETLLSLKLWIEDMFELTSSGIKAKYDFYSVGAVTSGR